MLDKRLLMEVQDRVFGMPAYAPHGMTTYCNLATLDVCHGVGCHEFDQQEGKEPLLADQMYALMKSSDKFKEVSMTDAIELAAEGVFILASLDRTQLGQSDGHICTLTIGEPEFSGHWNAEAPVCMNVGRFGTCFRNLGVNWAFRIMPDFFAWKETL